MRTGNDAFIHDVPLAASVQSPGSTSSSTSPVSPGRSSFTRAPSTRKVCPRSVAPLPRSTKRTPQRPRCVAFLGVGAYRTAFGRRAAGIGLQREQLAGAHVWVLPNPSGRTAAYQRKDFARLFSELRAFAMRSG